MPVTPEAPAVSTIDFTEPNSQVMPSSENYRLTGELPGREDRARTEAPAKKEDTIPPVKEGETAPPDSETAAASEAARTAEEKEQQQQRTTRTSESRWAKLSRENRELREKLTRAESHSAEQRTAEQQRETEQRSQAAAADATQSASKAVPKPKIDDVDPKTKQPKYKNWDEYEEAKDQWLQDEAVRKFQAESAKTQKEQQQTQAEQVIEQETNRRVESIRKTHPDYDQVLTPVLTLKDEHGQDAFFYTKGSHIDGFFLDSDRGHEVMYAIAKDFDQHKHIFARDAQGRYLLNPVRQVRELAKIENALPEKAAAGSGNDKSDAAAAASSSARPITQAARPPHQVSGTGTVGKDAVEQALEDGDFETYQKAQNAKELARLKRK